MLAVTLLTLGSPFKAAQELHIHLKRSTNESQLLPTIRQLKDLLDNLESKMLKAGFVKRLLGWHILVTSPKSGLQSLFKVDLAMKPGPKQVYPPGNSTFNLTRALGKLERIGEATFVIIKTPACVAVWIIAFVDWCLGVKPQIKGPQFLHASNLQSIQGRSSKVLIEILPSSSDVEKPIS